MDDFDEQVRKSVEKISNELNRVLTEERIPLGVYSLVFGVFAAEWRRCARLGHEPSKEALRALVRMRWTELKAIVRELDAQEKRGKRARH